VSKSKTRKPEFGKRGHETVELAAPKTTAMQRLKKMGSRWWRASGLKRKKDPQVKGFKRAGQRP
jgi:hypothetical protein